MTIAFNDHYRQASRLLLAVHGGEPETWSADVARAVGLWGTAALRVLAVVSVPRPPLASLLPAAARRYHGAREAWRRLESERLQPSIDRLLERLPGGGEVVWATDGQSDPGRTIAEHAAAWRADAVLVGAAPAPGPWLGAVHERLIRHAPCPVFVMPAVSAPRRRARVPASVPAVVGPRRGLARLGA